MARPNKAPSRYGGSNVLVGLRLRPVIAEQLYIWLKKHNIAHPVKPEGMRVIVTSSAKKVPGWYPKGDSMEPIVVHPGKAQWAMFGPRNNILILQLASPEIERRYYQLRNQGFRSKTNLHLKPGFTPYLVVAQGFNGSVESLPSFKDFPRDLIFDREFAEPIKENKVEKASIEELETIIEQATNEFWGNWWAQLSPDEQRQYLREHPRSRKKSSGKGENDPPSKQSTQPSEKDPPPKSKDNPPLKAKPASTKSNPKGEGKESAPSVVKVEDSDFEPYSDSSFPDPEQRKSLVDFWNTHLNKVSPKGYIDNIWKGVTGAQVQTTMLPVVGRNSQGVIISNSGTINSKSFRMKRKLHVVNGDLKVDHVSVEVPRTQQGKGLGKILLKNSIDQYKTLGVKKVELNANVDVGAYAWARYGFVPTSPAWDDLRKSLASRIEQGVVQIPDDNHRKVVEKLLQDPDPTTVWKLADMQHPAKKVYKDSDGKVISAEDHPLGKALLLDEAWRGELDMQDEKAMTRFRNYVGG